MGKGLSVRGVFRRMQSGNLVFSTQTRSIDGWPAAVGQLIAEHPTLDVLGGARLLQLRDGRPVAALTAPAA